MPSSNELSLGDAIREFLKEYQLEGKIEETRVIHAWEKVVGKMISKHTKNLYIKRKILFVKLDSPALANELGYAREKIKKSLNEEVGVEVIEDVKFI
ncbi:MAG: DUF721 domain-containing protein [Bacteroidota bacterium]|nr:DUF721 domain-containing protein [Bacteroidota bacterium]